MAVSKPISQKPRFSQEQLTELMQWFDLNSTTALVGENEEEIIVITVEKLQSFMALKKFHRRSFHYPTYTELMLEVEKMPFGMERILTYEDFINVLYAFVQSPNLKHELLLAFKVFDTENRDYLDVEEIKNIVSMYANKFNEAETLEIMRDANVKGDGNIYYADFIDSMFEIAPDLMDIKTEYLYENPDEDPSVEPEPVIEIEEEPLPEPEPEPKPEPVPVAPAKKEKKKK